MTAQTTAETTTPVICPGSGEFVHEDSVDGSSMTWCPTCGRRREADPVPPAPLTYTASHYFTVRAHRPLIHPDLGIHGPGCETGIHGICTCTGRTR
jgi:hypothetical protein